MIQVSLQEDFWRSETFLRKLKQMNAIDPRNYNYYINNNYNIVTETTKTPDTTVKIKIKNINLNNLIKQNKYLK